MNVKTRSEADSAKPLIVSLLLVVAILLFAWSWEKATLAKHDRETRASVVNPCTANRGNCFSIQGEYSQLHCPGQIERRVEIDDQSFFLECF